MTNIFPRLDMHSSASGAILTNRSVVADSGTLSPVADHNSDHTPISELISINPLIPHRSLLRRSLGPWLRLAYGNYRLALAPRQAFSLLAARPDSAAGRLVAAPGRIQAMASQPFVNADWSSSLRLRHMIEHCAVIDKLGHPFDIGGNDYVEIMRFELDDDSCRLMLDQPRWLECDGMLCVSLWAGGDRVFSISLCLSDDEAGGGEAVRTAYVGAIQGRRSEGALDQNRALTKAAHGMRPRDLAFELFRMLLPHLGVTQLKCVTDASRYQMTKRAMLTIGDKVVLDYDEVWESRGGVPGTDGFFAVPIAGQRRLIDDIPSKKRSMYKKRYALLDQYQSDIADALGGTFTIHRHKA
jgi:uncharacterized protein VirK/YbjX